MSLMTLEFHNLLPLTPTPKKLFFSLPSPQKNRLALASSS